MKKIYQLIYLVFLIMISPHIYAKDLPLSVDTVREVELGLGPTSPSNSGLNRSSYEITASTGNSVAEIKMQPVDDSKLSFVFSAPLDKNTSEGVFYSTKTDAFANAFKFKINYESQSSLIHDGVKSTDLDEMIAKAEEITSLCESNPEYFNFKNKEECSNFKIDDLVDKLDTYINSQGKRLATSGNSIDKNELINYWKLLVSKSIRSWGVNASIGKADYSYFDVGTIDKSSNSETPWSIGGYFNFLKPGEYTLTIDLEYQKAYEAQSNTTLCPNIPDGNNLFTCVTGAAGPPVEKTNKNLSLTWRKPLNLGKDNWSLAISPKLTHDFEDDETSFSLPVYFLKNKPTEVGDLTGGIRADWESTKDEWYFGIFVGSTFSLN